MNPVILFQAVQFLIDNAPKGVSLYNQIHGLLTASDEPAAKDLLTQLEATYAESGQAADAAIDDALAKSS